LSAKSKPLKKCLPVGFHRSWLGEPRLVQVVDLVFSDESNEVVQALKAMGYTERDAQMAAKNATGNTTSEKIKSALKQVGK
jgi:Holliday junction resolvasome RuvABC DNA-binding subunit